MTPALEQIKALHDWLHNLAEHGDKCPLWLPNGTEADCTCGLVAARALADTALHALQALRDEAGEAVTAWVGEMQTSAGTDYYVCVGRRTGDPLDRTYLTPQKYRIRGRAEYDVACWNHMLHGGPEPDPLAFDTDIPVMEVPSPTPAAEAAPQGALHQWRADADINGAVYCPRCSVTRRVHGDDLPPREGCTAAAPPSAPAEGRLCHCCGETFDRCRETYRGSSACTDPEAAPHAGVDEAWLAKAREMLRRLETMQPPNVVMQQITMLGDMAALLRCIVDFPLAAGALPQGGALVPREILDRFPEINPSNYDHDDVCALNAWGVELVLAAAPAQGVE